MRAARGSVLHEKPGIGRIGSQELRLEFGAHLVGRLIDARSDCSSHAAADSAEPLHDVDCRFDDSVELLKQVQAWFAGHMPSVTTKLVSLNNMYSRDDPQTWEMIRDGGDAAIVGVGH
jgi:hypothetical protein